MLANSKSRYDHFLNWKQRRSDCVDVGYVQKYLSYLQTIYL